MSDADDWTPLSGLYEWERKQPDAIYLTQPVGTQVTDYTWAVVGDQVRRIAAHLQSLQLPPGSQIALLSKNCAHWIMADLAIWMAGHVSVPIYPSLNAETVRYILDHSEARLLFLGRLEDWDEMRAGIPAKGLPIIELARSAIRRRYVREPLALGRPSRSQQTDGRRNPAPAGRAGDPGSFSSRMTSR
jgi:long-chain acyl-CoA synthetase